MDDLKFTIIIQCLLLIYSGITKNTGDCETLNKQLERLLEEYHKEVKGNNYVEHHSV